MLRECLILDDSSPHAEAALLNYQKIINIVSAQIRTLVPIKDKYIVVFHRLDLSELIRVF
jgi:hypothetical protein